MNLRYPVVISGKRSIAGSVLLCLTLVFPVFLSSQTSTEDVHITPRHVEDPNKKGAVMDGQPRPSLALHSKPLRADAELVMVPVTVRDGLNRPVTDLTKKNFALFEDEKTQDIQDMWKEDGPISIGLILDFSKSMSDKMEMQQEAVEEFFKNANPQDDYFVIAVSDRPAVIADSTDSIGDLQRRMQLVIPDGNTALLDAIYVGIHKMRSARYQRRALLIISDGGDNHSYYNAKQIRDFAREADVMMYSIGIFDNMPVPGFKTIEEKLGQHLLTTITELTGGYTVAADNRAKVPQFAADISRELREQYILVYKPNRFQRDGKWRKIKVQVLPNDSSGHLHVDYRRGYFSPA